MAMPEMIHAEAQSAQRRSKDLCASAPLREPSSFNVRRGTFGVSMENRAVTDFCDAHTMIGVRLDRMDEVAEEVEILVANCGNGGCILHPGSVSQLGLTEGNQDR